MMNTNTKMNFVITICDNKLTIIQEKVTLNFDTLIDEIFISLKNNVLTIKQEIIIEDAKQEIIETVKEDAKEEIIIEDAKQEIIETVKEDAKEDAKQEIIETVKEDAKEEIIIEDAKQEIIETVKEEIIIEDDFMTDYKKVFTSANISAKTRDNYINEFSKFKMLFPTIKSRKISPEEINEIFDNEDTSLSQKVLMTNAYLSYRKHKNLPREDNWQSFYKSLNDQKLKTINDIKPTKTTVPIHSNLKDLADKTDNNEMKLLIKLYTEIPPLRADYGNVLINHHEINNEVLIKTKQSFYDVANKQIHMFNLKLKLNKPLIITLPDDIVSLINTKQQYIFQTREGNPYTKTQFSRQMNYKLKQITDDPDFTLTDFRIAYISALDMNKLTTYEKAAIAHQMNQQSLATQDGYRLINNLN